MRAYMDIGGKAYLGAASPLWVKRAEEDQEKEK